MKKLFNKNHIHTMDANGIVSFLDMDNKWVVLSDIDSRRYISERLEWKKATRKMFYVEQRGDWDCKD